MTPFNHYFIWQKYDSSQPLFYFTVRFQFARIMTTLNHLFSSFLRHRLSPRRHHRVLHEQGQGLDRRLVRQGPRVQGSLGRSGSQDHHDRYPHRPPVVHLRLCQGKNLGRFHLKLKKVLVAKRCRLIDIVLKVKVLFRF